MLWEPASDYQFYTLAIFKFDWSGFLIFDLVYVFCDFDFTGHVLYKAP